MLVKLAKGYMKVSNMTSSSGREVPNQFIIEDEEGRKTFQSYRSTIAIVPAFIMGNVSGIYIDRNDWDYSRTTIKYLCQFLRHNTPDAINSKKDIQERIDSGYYQLASLNK